MHAQGKQLQMLYTVLLLGFAWLPFARPLAACMLTIAATGD